MAEQNGPPRWPTPEYFEKLYRFPQDELYRYAGKYVAYSEDATRIVESDADEAALYAKLEAAGYDLSRTLVSYVDTAESRL
jgi:hypothetical protein